jgi:tetratricopeptide (TPR) repeat protein
MNEAREAYEKALELDPAYVPVLLNLGNVHYPQDRLVAARACYERALRIEPTNAKARYNLANVQHDLKE